MPTYFCCKDTPFFGEEWHGRMTATDSSFLILSVSFIPLLISLVSFLFLCHWRHMNFISQEQKALLMGLFSFAGSFVLFLVFTKTISDVCLMFLSWPSHKSKGPQWMVLSLFPLPHTPTNRETKWWIHHLFSHNLSAQKVHHSTWFPFQKDVLKSFQQLVETPKSWKQGSRLSFPLMCNCWHCLAKSQRTNSASSTLPLLHLQKRTSTLWLCVNQTLTSVQAEGFWELHFKAKSILGFQTILVDQWNSVLHSQIIKGVIHTMVQKIHISSTWLILEIRGKRYCISPMFLVEPCIWVRFILTILGAIAQPKRQIICKCGWVVQTRIQFKRIGCSFQIQPHQMEDHSLCTNSIHWKWLQSIWKLVKEILWAHNLNWIVFQIFVEMLCFCIIQPNQMFSLGLLMKLWEKDAITILEWSQLKSLNHNTSDWQGCQTVLESQNTMMTSACTTLITFHQSCMLMTTKKPLSLEWVIWIVLLTPFSSRLQTFFPLSNPFLVLDSHLSLFLRRYFCFYHNYLCGLFTQTSGETSIRSLKRNAKTSERGSLLCFFLSRHSSVFHQVRFTRDIMDIDWGFIRFHFLIEYLPQKTVSVDGMILSNC